MNQEFQSALPALPLQGMVKKYWRTSYTNAKVEEIQLYPKGLYYLIFSFRTKGQMLLDGQIHKDESDAFVVGQPKDHRVSFFSQKDSKIVVVELTPTGLYRLFGIPVHHFNNTIEDLEMVDPYSRVLFQQLAETDDFNEITGLLDQYLTLQILKKDKALSPYVNNAYDKISKGYGKSVDQLSKEIFISKRQLQRSFIDQVGLSPKAVIAMQKAHQVIMNLLYKRNLNIEQLSYKLGYSDPSHLSKSFKKHFGTSPINFNPKKILGVEKFHGWKKFSSFIK